jgi:hypothetical protein
VTFRIGTGRIGYDYFGDWTRVHEGRPVPADGVVGDPCWPGEMQPGAVCLGLPPRPVRYRVGVE